MKDKGLAFVASCGIGNGTLSTDGGRKRLTGIYYIVCNENAGFYEY